MDTQTGLRCDFAGYIFELKAMRDVPTWMLEMIERFNLIPIGFSKYATAHRLEGLSCGRSYTASGEKRHPLNRVMEQFFDLLNGQNELILPQVFVSLCTSFVLGLVLASVYRWTHQGFSYARSFIHTIVLSSLVITIMVMAIGNNMARGLGILGAMAFIRFRTPIRDPRDIIFLFAALALGISAGAQVYDIAIVGTLFFAGAAFFLTYSPFASRREFEGLLRFILPNDSRSEEEIDRILPGIHALGGPARGPRRDPG